MYQKVTPIEIYVKKTKTTNKQQQQHKPTTNTPCLQLTLLLLCWLIGRKTPSYLLTSSSSFSSVILYRMISPMVWMTVVVFRRSSMLPYRCSCYIAPRGHCCFLASLNRRQNCRSAPGTCPVWHGQSVCTSPSQHVCWSRW